MDIINREYPPGVFFKGSQIFGQKNKGSEIFRRKFKIRGLKSISKFEQIFFKISIFLEDTDPNIEKIVTISKKMTDSETNSMKFPRKYD